MTSHDKHSISLPEEGLPLMDKTSQWAPSDTVVARREDGRRRHPAVRLFLAFLICSMVLFGLALVHSPSFRQRFSCHGMMGNVKPGVELEGEAQPSTLAAIMDKEAPQTSNESVDISLPNQPGENRQEGGDSYHATTTLKTTRLQLLRRETNSSSVTPESSATAKTADPDPTATPTASSKPSSTAEPPTSSASPTPSSPASSTSKTSTTTPATSPQTSTTKAPEPTTSSSTPEPPNTVDTTIYTTRPANPTAPPPTTPKVIIETSTRTSNGEVVIVESTITVQPSITQPVSVTDPARPPPSLQNSATRQEGDVMVLAGLLVTGAIGVLLY